MSCKTVFAGEISAGYREEIKTTINTKGIHPKLVGFLANQDPAAFKYAEATAKTCAETGVVFELKKCNREDLEDEIVKANEDENINGIMVYYPVFGDRQDQYLQNVVDSSKDVEGLCHKYIYNMYHNIRFLDKAQTKKCIIPCTPLAIIKVMEYIRVYNPIITYGNRLHGRIITIVNRSEIVGRPLAALLANDGGKVYSVDINGIQEFNRGTGLRLKKHEVSIPGWTLVDALLGLDKYVSYQIYWMHGQVGKLFINRRYTDFYKLHKKLVHKYGNSAIPPLTPKKRYGRFNPDFIEYRRFHLEFYLQYLALTNRDELIAFLGGNKQGTKILTDGGPRNTKNKSNIIIKSDLPQRGCLITGSRRNEKIRVHFADEV
ncbi:337_t:CDS:2, partial [Scutellospora calospora]